MPEREIRQVASLQQWRGVDQRTQATLVKDGFASFSAGLFFGLGDNAERLPGKTLSLVLPSPIFHIQPFGSGALVQTLDILYRVDREDLLPIISTLNFISNGDANGVAYLLGTNFGAVAWTNPHTAGRLTVVTSPPDGGANPALVVDRANNDFNTTNVALSFIGVDVGFGRTLRVNAYSIRNRASFSTDSIRNWKLQGANMVAGNTEAQWNAATWTDLDTHVADATISAAAQWGTFTLALTAGYRYLRVLQTGLNSSGGNHLCFGEFEFYGRLIR